MYSVLAVVVLAGMVPGAEAQMTTGSDMPGFADAFRLGPNERSPDFTAQEIEVKAGETSGANVLWPGETVSITIRFTNQTSSEVKAKGMIDVISYGTSVPVGDIWAPHVFKIADEGSTPFAVALSPSGSQDVQLHPVIPEHFGGYALVVDLPGHGRSFVATFVRTLRADPGRTQFPTYALDGTWDEFMNEGVFTLFQKLGVRGIRLGGAFNPQADSEYRKSMDSLDRYMQWARKHDVTVMLTVGSGEARVMQPLGRPRPWLSSEDKMLDTKDDRAWLPSYDDEFQSWMQMVATKYGWPEGNLNAVELWNEPWESISISGWGADIERYRELYTRMAQGIVAARKQAGIKVLIGGACSSTNTRDKLFSDGDNHFLQWLDFVSIHYQALAADPSLVPEWVHRQGPYGPVRVWDTESWIANSEDRVAGVIASMRAQGQDRTAGVFDGNVYRSRNIKLDGRVYPVVQAWSPAAAVAATQKFIGQRSFRELLFQNGLPWVFVFDGLADSATGKVRADDGTVVIVGDLKKIYEPERTLFRSVEVAADAHMTISNEDSTIQFYDFYGNKVAAKAGSITVPLNGLGYFLRTDGSTGSFQHLLDAIRTARIEGYSPVEIVARDLTKPVGQHPVLKLTVTNVMNRAITGQLIVTLGDLALKPTNATLSLEPNESRDVEFGVAAGDSVSSNIYPLTAQFKAGRDGSVIHKEDMKVNFITRRTIHVDGDLGDWEGVLPQVLPSTKLGTSLTEEAWLPFKDFSKQAANGSSVAYLAYDDDYFYFAAKTVDTTPDPGMLRFAARDDDSYFYPDQSIGADAKTLNWPVGVRHYSYRRNFDIPSGTEEHDNVQIAFNVLSEKPWLAHPPGVMPNFITYWDTDYEYALNPVAQKYGGGTEIWRLLAPGMPRKHFFPRQPRSPIDGGPVTDGKLVVRREGNTRIVEAAIPWNEMPEVRARLVAGETVKFTCRVNDNQGPAHELAAGRSVSKANSVTFHDDWQNHWANELEFGVEK